MMADIAMMKALHRHEPQAARLKRVKVYKIF
jgi:hypothetical protein